MYSALNPTSDSQYKFRKSGPHLNTNLTGGMQYKLHFFFVKILIFQTFLKILTLGVKM